MRSARPPGVFYAAKAFCSRAVLRWVERRRARRRRLHRRRAGGGPAAGVPPEQITMHGNNKSLDELAGAISAGVGHIVARLLRGDRPAGPPDPCGRSPPNGPPPGPTSWSGSPPGWRRTRTSSWPPRTTTRSSASRCPPAPPTRRSAGSSPARAWSLPGCTRTSARRSSTPPGFEVAAHRVIELAAGSATSTASRSPSSTWAAGSASPTPTRTTRRRSRSSRQSLRQIVDRQCRPPA